MGGGFGGGNVGQLHLQPGMDAQIILGGAGRSSRSMETPRGTTDSSAYAH